MAMPYARQRHAPCPDVQTYRDNAVATQAELDLLGAEIAAMLARPAAAPLVVFQEACPAFEARFGVKTRAAINPDTGTAASAWHLTEVRDVVYSGRAAGTVRPD